MPSTSRAEITPLSSFIFLTERLQSIPTEFEFVVRLGQRDGLEHALAQTAEFRALRLPRHGGLKTQAATRGAQEEKREQRRARKEVRGMNRSQRSVAEWIAGGRRAGQRAKRRAGSDCQHARIQPICGQLTHAADRPSAMRCRRPHEHWRRRPRRRSRSPLLRLQLHRRSSGTSGESGRGSVREAHPFH